MRFLEKLIANTTIGIGCLILVLMVVQIVADVTMRATVGSGFPATSELVSKYYMVAVSFLPIAYAELKSRHVEATIFTDWLPLRGRRAIEVLGYLFSLAVYGALTWGTAVEALSKTEERSYVESGVDIFYTWPSYWILPISFGLMTLVLFMKFNLTIYQIVMKRVSKDTSSGTNEALVSSEG